MALRKLATGYHDGGEDVIFIKDTPLYKAASKEGDTKRLGTSYSGMSMNKVIPPPSTLSIDQIHHDSEEASSRYSQTVDFIVQTNTADEARKYVKQAIYEATNIDNNTFDHGELDETRAVVFVATASSWWIENMLAEKIFKRCEGKGAKKPLTVVTSEILTTRNTDARERKEVLQAQDDHKLYHYLYKTRVFCHDYAEELEFLAKEILCAKTVLSSSM
ncbi:hypothetical protein BGZ60DRAFT_431544 [Tricladium varicosporioides]|nr:hypothetical protein BGZ60DRAFT_431544 [Hymenoscyphus varicosporioides]